MVMDDDDTSWHAGDACGSDPVARLIDAGSWLAGTRDYHFGLIVFDPDARRSLPRWSNGTAGPETACPCDRVRERSDGERPGHRAGALDGSRGHYEDCEQRKCWRTSSVPSHVTP